MLTVKIKDKRLEERITERAQRFGKNTQDYVNELLAIVLPDAQDVLSFKRLKAEDYGYVMNFEAESNEAVEDTTPFSEVTDTESYTKDLRKKAWRKE
ncbi:hypothetical protein [Parapedobacter tibetensis]|uniref:hypothetical protein n=1 Tax=Parapedobacter tibetensis TaxID=2972951 RepID=UPI00214DD89C|nr:hypothetical protein [Parapedobacter tibetensis]